MLLNINECFHLAKASGYNDNYYLLPFEINGCRIVHIQLDDCSGQSSISIGNFNPEVYHEEYFLNSELIITNDAEEVLDFNIKDLSSINMWA